MLELLTNISIENVIFVTLSVFAIFSSAIAIMANNLRTSVLFFLVASVSVSGIIFFVSKTLLAAIILSIYVSISSLFITISRNRKSKSLRTEYFIIGLVIFLLLLIIYAKSSRIIDQNSMVDTGNYAGIAGITLFMSVMFVYIVFGVVSIIKRK